MWFSQEIPQNHQFFLWLYTPGWLTTAHSLGDLSYHKTVSFMLIKLKLQEMNDNRLTLHSKLKLEVIFQIIINGFGPQNLIVKWKTLESLSVKITLISLLLAPPNRSIPVKYESTDGRSQNYNICFFVQRQSQYLSGYCPHLCNSPSQLFHKIFYITFLFVCFTNTYVMCIISRGRPN